MRRRSRLLFWQALLVLALVSCTQEPANLSPVTDELNWRTISEIPDPGYLDAIWGTDPGNVYVTLDDRDESRSPLLRFDGVSWNDVVLPAGVSRAGKIVGTGPNDIWVPTNTGLLHFDGAGWVNTGIYAYAIAATAAGVVYAVLPGQDDVLARYNGASWDTLGTIPNYTHELWASDEPRVTIAFDAYPEDSILWWDGVSFSTTRAPGNVSCLWGETASGLMAGGFASGNAAIWQWDGVDWQPMAIPSGVDRVWDIEGNNASDLYATSCCGTLLHYDGATWQTAPIPTGSGLDQLLVTSNDLYVTQGRGTVMHRGVGGWETLMGGGPHDISGIWADSPSRGVAVSYVLETWEWNGRTWTERSGEDASFRGLVELGGRAMDDIYAVSRDGLTYHFDGNSWSFVTNLDLGFNSDLVMSAKEGTLYAASFDGVFRLDGDSWTQLYDADGNYLLALWAGEGGEVFVGGNVFVHLRGDAVVSDTQLPDGFGTILGVSGVSNHEVYLAAQGALLKYDGTDFAVVGPPGGYDQVAAAPNGDVVAFGYRNSALKADGVWLRAPVRRVASTLSVARDGSFIRFAYNTGLQSIAYLDE